MWKWSLTSVVVNLLLGVPAVVPIFLCWYFAANGPLADLGWTQREPTENDGMLLWLVIIVPVVVGFALLWWLANYPVRRRIPMASRLYWPASTLLTLAPTVVLMAVL
ncbi:hypothetical protein ACIBJC_17845 [Streptomyces sp. NPDC050509]|uniref:hypothetical protein n=1 Tax=Streptomyces sp. NPDC050509 TaxID=3365620 RepID=UPI0037B1CBF0